MAKYLDLQGLRLFWRKAKAYADSAVGSLGGDLAAGAGINLLPDTNLGLGEWSASYSANGKMLIQENGDWIKVSNFASSPRPGWQYISRSIPSGLLAKGETATVSFAVSASTGASAIVLEVSVGDSASTRVVATSGWLYAANGTSRVSVPLTGLIDGGTASGDLLKISIVSGQNEQWKEFAIKDVQLERGSTPTAYRPSTADTAARIKSLESELAALNEYLNGAILKSLQELEANQNRMGPQICVLSGWDPLDFYDPEKFPVGAAIFSDDDYCIYEVVNNPVTRKREFALSERWNRNGEARTDVLYLYEGTWMVWRGDTNLVEVPNNVPDAPNFSLSEL